jgi:hypothetical protein
MAKKGKVRWADAPAAQDYPAAGSYLRLLALPATVEALTKMLSEAPTVHQAAKDILRAAGLPLLAADDPEVVKDMKKVAKGEPLSPILLVRGDLAAGRSLQVADGYHRVCASYHLGEDTEIPCRIADVPGSPSATARSRSPRVTP